MFYSKILFYIFSVFFACIWFADSILEIPYIMWVLGILSVLGFVRSNTWYIGLGALMITAGLFLYQLQVTAYTFPHSLEGEHEAYGKIISEVLENKGTYQFRVRDENGYKLRVKTYSRGLQYGDQISFTCYIKKPEPFENFNYPKYLIMKKVHAACKSNVVYKKKGGMEGVYGGILKIKYILVDLFKENLPEPHDAFMAGLLVGGTSGLPESVIADFQKTGTSHIVAVSGFNVSIIILLIVNMMSQFAIRRSVQFWGITIGLIVFNMITGFQASIVRAVIMGWVVVLARTKGRILNFRNLLCYAAAILICMNPLALRYDLGFQLSFIATLGLVYGTALVEYVVKRKITNKLVAEYLMPSIIAYIWTLPIIILNFERVSLVAPIVNIVIAPLIPIGMLAGTLILLLFWMPGISFFANFFGWGVLELILQAVHIGASFAWSETPIERSTSIIISVTIFVTFFCIWIHQKLHNKKLVSTFA